MLTSTPRLDIGSKSNVKFCQGSLFAHFENLAWPTSFIIHRFESLDLFVHPTYWEMGEFYEWAFPNDRNRRGLSSYGSLFLLLQNERGATNLWAMAEAMSLVEAEYL